MLTCRQWKSAAAEILREINFLGDFDYNTSVKSLYNALSVYSINIIRQKDTEKRFLGVALEGLRRILRLDNPWNYEQSNNHTLVFTIHRATDATRKIKAIHCNKYDYYPLEKTEQRRA